MLQIVLPVLYYIPGDQNHHSYENSLDALLMIKNDAKLLVMSGMFTEFSMKSLQKFARYLENENILLSFNFVWKSLTTCCNNTG